MRLILLGSTGYHPNERRHTPCLALPELGVVLDAGTAMFRLRDLLVTPELSIFLTHAHLDHCFGLTFLFDVLYQRPTKKVFVYGEAEKLAVIQEHLLSPLLFPAKLPCEYRELPAAGVELPEGGRLTHFPLKHPGGSLGFRLDWAGHSLAYVTDTTADPDADYVERIREVDLLIHECYFSDENHAWAAKTGHSWTTPVAKVARKARVGRLVLVHLNPLVDALDPIGLDVARAIFPETSLGQDRMEIEF